MVLLKSENLSKYNWFQVGGNADVFIPDNKNELMDFLKKNNDRIVVLGGGSNVLIKNQVDAIFILTKNFNKIEIENGFLKVGCGILNSKLYTFCRDNEVGGYEFLGTIPGTLGGAIRGNAGCYDNEIKDFLIEFETIDYNGNIKIFKKKDCNFEYRKNNLPENLIFTSALLKIQNSTKNEIETKYNGFLEKRKSQPVGRTAGSTFKNLPDRAAWKVVEELGYKGKEINGVKMSEKHANFLMNINGDANDIENLINMIKNDAKKVGIDLELEIKIIK
ncbi:MAG: UDP-N-acetylmuramate dehydrogenase [Rickettsiales bacterium]|jgi:UDP-N-acetylmuramate dehydrogenase|nr:UDP-N-acetylmuramate dehydrogenase [Rickettsiales bacterium]